MKFTVNEIFERVIPYIPEKLISSGVISEIKKLNKKFPAGLSTNGIFECPLGINTPVTDFSVAVTAGDGGREIIAGKTEGIEIDKSLLKSPVWKKIRSFCEKWSQPESLLYKNTGIMGLEFDMESLRKKIPLPGIFFNAHISPEKEFSSHKIHRYKWVIEGLECLRRRPLKKEIIDKLIYCFDAFPDNGRLGHAALMLSRPLDAVRVVISIPEDELKGYLSLIKYPGESQELLDLVTELSQFTHLRYNLDISHKVLSKIGIECFLKDKKKTQKENWRKLLNHLVERSLCIPEKRDALLDWPGHTYTTLPQDTEPCYIFRRISHIKVVYEKDKPLLAKAYPEFFRAFEIDLLYEKLLTECNTI